MNYGLIGKTLKHSFSREIHQKLGYDYLLKELEPIELESFFREKNFKAINVTVPYKVDVMKYLDSIDENAISIGAVNTVLNSNGKLLGYNTDFFGMKDLIERTGVSLKNKKVLILGTGGTSNTAEYTARHLGASEVLKVSRTKKDGVITYDEIETAGANVIINTTPAGMFPNNGNCPIKGELPEETELVVDVIYNPLRTRLLQKAEEKGIFYAGGLYMLVSQGIYASCLFTGNKEVLNKTEEVYKSVLSEKQNIVLIGMPGSGKSTAAKYLGNFIDTDDEIEKEYGVSPKDIILGKGEKAFREIESETVLKLSRKNGIVISTGGGVVLNPENIRTLKENGIVIFLDPPFERLTATKSRPLSDTKEKLLEVYKERYEIYNRNCDIKISGDYSPEEIADIIKKEVSKYEDSCNKRT